MSDESVRSVLELAETDMSRGDLRRAKDRLKAVIRNLPNYRPALEMLGRIYYEHGDYRNAVLFWSQAERWDDCMLYACERVFAAVGRALVREHIEASRYQLYAFAGSSPPRDIAQRLYTYQSAYFKLDNKRSRLMGLSCVPMAGCVLLVVLSVISALLGGGRSSFAWIFGFVISSAALVFGINVLLYMRASSYLNKALEQFRNEGLE